ncbi:sulfotransferase [Nonomuraea fuscirosea]|jgi:hypothetical protein|uniref:sulfotransferase family protein n=1 Tax=Nonomuraea fuscirosea TaxID=1291556 RepID=UPI003444DB3F
MARSADPLFLLAPARSYSTVSVALLSGHRRLFGFPEMLIFSEPPGRLISAAENEAGIRRAISLNRLSGIRRAVAEIEFGDQRPTSIEGALAWLKRRSHWSGQRLFNHLLARIAPLTGIEKSPETVLSEQALRRCVTSYPQARFIHLTRHPTTSLRSMIDHFGRFPGAVGERPALYAAYSWYSSHRRILRATNKLPVEQAVRIRSEDLLRDPLDRLPLILDWLSLEYDDDCLARMLRTEEWPFSGTGDQHDLLGGDWKFLTSPQLKPVTMPDEVVFDDTWCLPGEVKLRIVELARELGYVE